MTTVIAAIADIISEEVLESNRISLADHTGTKMVSIYPKVNGSVSDADIERETRDFTEINRHIEKVVLPRLNVYCTRLAIRKDMRHVVLECVGILYTYLYADTPIFDYERRLRNMIRYYKQHGDLGYYDHIPEPIHEAVDTLDVSVLEQKFVVKRQH